MYEVANIAGVENDSAVEFFEDCAFKECDHGFCVKV